MKPTPTLMDIPEYRALVIADVEVEALAFLHGEAISKAKSAKLALETAMNGPEPVIDDESAAQHYWLRKEILSHFGIQEGRFERLFGDANEFISARNMRTLSYHLNEVKRLTGQTETPNTEV